ncbi:hypothetical protein C4588_06195 [Candidatus Parcubacteria bacterium]|nr:MAG: hypothetical protein C4588_06195 [Candidatus Parcubacteria bacterium]
MGWQPEETALYNIDYLAWLYLPKNPIASGICIAHKCCVKKDDPETYPEHLRKTVDCWWANGRYYEKGHITNWMSLPDPPSVK